MLLIRGLVNVPKIIGQTAIALGDFDGVHLGHQAIIHRLIQEAKIYHLTSVLICFEPQSAEFFQQQFFSGRILRLREKLKVFDTCHIDYVLCLKFNDKLAALSAEQFTQQILVNQLHLKRLIVGHDCSLGKGKTGKVNELFDLAKRYHFTLIVESIFKIHGERNSSTRIRKALQKGNFDLVKQLMGRTYQLSGKVRHGDGRGKSLGFPTANIPLFHYKMTISGIFVVNVTDHEHHQWYGVANLGTRPTFGGHECILEVYLLDFHGDLYGKNLSVEFLHKLRDEAYFDSVNQLKAQMQKDVDQARQWLVRRP